MKSITRSLFFLFLAAGWLLSACTGATLTPVPAASPTNPPSPTLTQAEPTSAPTTAVPASTVSAANPGQPVLTVLVHDSFAVTDSLIADFEQQNNVKVNFIKGGDAGAMLNRAILTKDNPQADVMYGVDNTFLSRALEAGIYAPYNSPQLASVVDTFKLDPQNGALPVDYGDVCLNYDKKYFADKGLKVPTSLEDLALPEYRGLLVVENPATSSPGLAFLLASVAHFGPDGYLDYWKKLRANEVAVVNDWNTAYYTNFSGSSGKGAQPLVVSYASSPAAEVVFANPPITESPTGSVVAPGTCFRQEEFVGILKGTKQRTLAEKFVDFMLSKPFQEDMPLQMYVYPVRSDAKLPDVFRANAQVPGDPAQMDPAEIAKNRDAWIQAWDTVVLQ